MHVETKRKPICLPNRDGCWLGDRLQWEQFAYSYYKDQLSHLLLLQSTVHLPIMSLARFPFHLVLWKAWCFKAGTTHRGVARGVGGGNNLPPTPLFVTYLISPWKLKKGKSRDGKKRTVEYWKLRVCEEVTDWWIHTHIDLHTYIHTYIHIYIYIDI